jgi:hypothetical protein
MPQTQAEIEQDRQLAEKMKALTKSGRLQHLIFIPPFMWTERDHHTIKGVLAFVASRALRGQL